MNRLQASAFGLGSLFPDRLDPIARRDQSIGDLLKPFDFLDRFELRKSRRVGFAEAFSSQSEDDRARLLDLPFIEPNTNE